MSIRVRLEHGQGAGTTWRLTQPGVYVLGRAKDNSIQVLDMKVSKEHCEIHLGADGTSALLHDLGSTHGVMVNGQPKREDTPLKAGDELRMGLSILRVLSDGDADHDIAPKQDRNVDASSVDTSSGTPEAATKHSLPPDELVGKDMSGYRIERKIGAGGMGGVYLAEQVSLKRQVALKVLNERFGSDSSFVDQFVNEARAAGALNHPNVVQVYDVGSAHGHYFFSMEVMPGGSIEDRIKESGGQVDWQDALNWFLDASNALIFARKKEILHRDVKPDNLMLAEDGSAKLCDLGLAKKSENNDLMAQGIIGTPHFISPEAIRRKPDIDHRTDLYSLGCSFYRILTGRNPFPGKTVKEILLGHLNKVAPRVSDKRDGIPRDLDDVVYKLMAKTPEERYQTPEELLAALDKVRLRHGLEAHGIRPHSRKPMIIAAAVAVLAIGAGIFFATREHEPVVAPETPEQIAMRKKAEIGAVRSKVDRTTNDTVAKFNEWQGILLKEDLYSSGDGWNQPKKWAEFLEDHRDHTKTWNETATTWLAEADKQKYKVAAQLLRDGSTTLLESAKKAEKQATDAEKYIKGRKDNQKRIAAAKKKANEDLVATFTTLEKKVKAALDGKRWLEAAELLQEHAVQALADPFRKLEESGVVLLTDKVIDDQVKKSMGAVAKQGAFLGYYGSKHLNKARTQMVADHAEQMKVVPKGDATKEQLAAAVAKLREYLPTIPENPPKGAGTLAILVKEQRREVEQAIKTLEKRRIRRILADYRADQQGFYEAIKPTYAARGVAGFSSLRKLNFADAIVTLKEFETKARTPEYKTASAHLIRSARAMQALFDKAVATYPKEWTSDKYPYVDKRGKTKTNKFKSVSAEGFKLGSHTHTFNSWTTDWLLKNFFLDTGKPRFEMKGEVLLGLAAFAELAADFEVAKSAYTDYLASLPDDEENASARAGVQWRLASLPAEERAARAFLESVEILQDAEKAADRFDPAIIGEEEFAKLKEELFNEAHRLRPLLQKAQSLRTEIREDAQLASTLWGAATREGALHPDTAFVGEKLPDDPDPPPTPPAKKDDPKDKPPAKDGDAKGDATKDAPPAKDGDAKKDDDPKGGASNGTNGGGK